MKTPPFLQKGDKIAITAAARKISANQIKNGIAAIEQMGFVPVISKSIGAEHFIFAGNDELRCSEFQALLNTPEIKAIWLARGGYGSIRILDQLDWSHFIKNPKWIIGFSDVTNLLAKVNDLGFDCIHGPMPKTLSHDFEDDVSFNLLQGLLTNKSAQINWKASENCKSGTTTAQIIGGNLASLAHLNGALSNDFFDNKILFIEDIDEYLYQIDRMLRGMKLSGKLQRLKGILVGDFTDLKDNDEPFGESLEQIILNLFSDLEIPIAFGFKAGHESVNWPIQLGKTHTLSNKNGYWSLKP